MEHKQPDEMENEDERHAISFETELGTTSKFQLFVQRNWKTISIAFAALAVIAGVFFLMKYLNDKAVAEALMAKHDKEAVDPVFQKAVEQALAARAKNITE